MPPPPATETVASRLFLGPALRAQSDGRLVRLVREGYESAFEEIVRRYDKALGRYATAIVGGRAEDVTQDAFSKAFQALRRDESEIELRPWLYRIVRNTALNDLRDRPPTPDELDEAIAGGRSAAEEAERREEVTELMTRLRALPEPQRAAIVMRELEGLSHDEIAAALGVTGGAARQFIYRARVALRNGVGMLIPLPLLRLLIEHGTEAATAGAGAATVAAGTTVGGAGAGTALKVGVVTAILAGSVGTGIATRENHSHSTASAAAPASVAVDPVDQDVAGTPTRPRSSPPALAPGSSAAEDHNPSHHDGAALDGPEPVLHSEDDHSTHAPRDDSHHPGHGPRGSGPDGPGRGGHLALSQGPKGDGHSDGDRGHDGHPGGAGAEPEGGGSRSGPTEPQPPEDASRGDGDNSGSNTSGDSGRGRDKDSP